MLCIRNGKKKERKGQAIVADLFIAVSVFFIIFLLITMLFNFYTSRLNAAVARDELQNKAFQLTEILLSEGKPFNWTAGTYTLPGLAVYEKHITSERLEQLKAIQLNNFKDKLGLEGFDFYIRIIKLPNEFLDDYGSNVDLRGKEVISLNRIVIYNNAAARLEVYVWRS